MADAYTPNYNLTLPEVGGSPDTWGDKVNQNFSQIDNNMIPTGGIIMWSGVTSSIPSSWALCDGTQGTPDLSGKFIIGTGGGYDSGDTGGSEETVLSKENLPPHDHNVSVDNDTGDHGHEGRTERNGTLAGTEIFDPKVKTTFAKVAPANFTDGTIEIEYVNPSGSALDDSIYGAVHRHAFEIGNDFGMQPDPLRGRHSHTVAQESVGQAEPFEIRPPFYALAFIMKL